MASSSELLASASALADGPRRILGITGAPGAGKTVLATWLVNALGPRARLVGMDGFHLRTAELTRLGRLERKGAPDTFDVAGYVQLLRRLRNANAPVVQAPCFDRSLEEPVPDAIAIGAAIPLIVTEGNYLLADGPWSAVRALLDECWYVELDEAERLRRLVARHRAYGRSETQAHERAYGSDLRNAELIAATRNRATRIVTVPPLEVSPRT